MGIYKQNVLMTGNGSESFTIPDGPAFMSVINNTDNVIWVHQERVTSNNTDIALVKIPQYTSLTIPITRTRRDFTVFYQNGGGVGTKKAEFMFSAENLQINSLLGTNVTGTITVGADGVGLAREAKQDTMITLLQTLVTGVQTLVTEQQETNVKLQSLIDKP